MRRETRGTDNKRISKNMLYIAGSILGLAVIAFIITLIVYGSKAGKNSNASRLNTEQLMGMVNETNTMNNTNTTQASTQIGKSVEESKNEQTNTTEKIAVNTSTMNVTEENKNTTKQTNSTNTKKNTAAKTEAKEEKKEETKKEEAKDPTFTKPVEGDVVREFAKDNLIFSQTLNEWTTHLGIDIKAEKTSIVKTAADGKVKAIKNDPRYGLTVIIEHTNGFTSVYSNLLTAEFVVAGEEVKQGQTIGTVGNTATFEIADECHLHFEILKDNVQVDPSIYLK